MGDAAEKWLVEHDPDYDANSGNWKHIQNSGAYRRPRQEIPWGLADDLERLVESEHQEGERRGPKARGYVGEVEQRLCERCGGAFTPTNSWNRFCTGNCQRSAWKRAKRRQKKRDMHSS